MSSPLILSSSVPSAASQIGVQRDNKVKTAKFNKTASNLFDYDIYQVEDELDKNMERDFREISDRLAEKSELERSTFLQSHVASQDAHIYEQTMNALLYAVLSNGESYQQYYQYLMMCVRDNFSIVVSRLKYFTGALYPQLQEQPKKSIVWLVEKLMEKNVAQIEKIVLALLRNIQVGSRSKENWFLINSLIEMFSKHVSWVKARHGIISTSVFVFLRTLVDLNPEDENDLPLINRLSSHCKEYLLENMLECKVIGRDLVRALHDISRYPAVHDLCNRVMNNNPPIQNHPGLISLLSMPTPKHFLQTRLLHEMEANLLFILENINWGSTEDFYFTWFHQMYLAPSGQSPTIVCELIRYVMCAFHPSNELLQSKIIPRYAVLGKLLQYITKEQLPATVQVALMFDWICFDFARESIMDVESSALLLLESVEKLPILASCQLNAIEYLATKFFPPLGQWFMSNIKGCVVRLMELKVVRNFDRVLNSAVLKPKYLNLAQKYLGNGDAPVQKESAPKTAPSDETLRQTRPELPVCINIHEEPDYFWKSAGSFNPVLNEKDVEFQIRLSDVLSFYWENKIQLDKMVSQVAPVIRKRLTVISAIDDMGLDLMFQSVYLEFSNESRSSPTRPNQELFQHLLQKLSSMGSYDKGSLSVRFLLYAVRKRSDFKIFDAYSACVDENQIVDDVICLAHCNIEYLCTVLPILLRHLKVLPGNLELIHQVFCSLDADSMLVFSRHHSLGAFSLFCLPDRMTKLAVDIKSVAPVTAKWDVFEQVNFWSIVSTEIRIFPAVISLFLSADLQKHLRESKDGSELQLGIFKTFADNVEVLASRPETIEFIFDCTVYNMEFSRNILRVYLARRTQETVQSIMLWFKSHKRTDMTKKKNVASLLRDFTANQQDNILTKTLSLSEQFKDLLL